MNHKLLIRITLCLLLAAGLRSQLLAAGYLYVKAAPSGAQVSTKAADFVDVPDLNLNFYQYYPRQICIGFSAEGYTVPDARMFLRALVDGQPASPADVIIFNKGFYGTRAFLFVANVGGGLHEVKIQYHIDPGAEAFLGDRTMWVITAPNLMNGVAAPSGPDVSTTSGAFVDIPDFALNIQNPEAADWSFIISGETETTNNKRTFVRALLDNQPALPSDVVFNASGFLGTNAFTFTIPNIAAGNHTLQMQWKVDGGGAAYMGDRTVAVGLGIQSQLAAGEGGIISKSAPSGPQISTTNAYFTTIQDLETDVYVPENGSMVIGLTAEVYTSAGKRTFVRALVNGVAANPSDVVFNASDFTGTFSYYFVKKNVHGGLQNVVLQWLVDGGGTAWMGDRNLTVIALPTPGPDMTVPFNEIKPVTGAFPLLVIGWDPQRPEHPAPAMSAVQQLIFGPNPSVQDYFRVNSHNRFWVEDVGVKGWYPAQKPWSHYWGPEDPSDSDGDGWISGHVEKWAEAIRKADQSFDFKPYDHNNDGFLSTDELGILIVIPQNNPFGTNRIAVGKQYPTQDPLIVDGVTITWIAEAYIGAPLNLGVTVHELCHLFLHLPDMYYTFFLPYAAGAYSIMDATYGDNHIDPFHKIRLGWIQAPMILATGYYPFDAVETSHVAYILHDPGRGSQEYFIIENRQPGLAYDSAIPDQGLGIWHIMEDPNVYQNLTTPPGVNAADWASISPYDWGRRAIRMIRPVYGPPFDNRKALWDGSDPATGYDLLSNDPNPNHVTLKWSDGMPTGFSVRKISAAGPHMEALVEVPWQPLTAVDGPGLMVPIEFGLEQNYPNPFNPETNITFSLAEDSPVTLKIFNVLGQEVITLLSQDFSRGRHTILWNGRDAHAQKVPAGVYFYQLQTKSKIAVRKLVLIP